MSDKIKKTAIFIMPRSSRAWFGAEAMWISVAGIAEAARRKIGDAVVMTTDRIAHPKEVMDYPRIMKGEEPSMRYQYSFLPMFIRVLLNDILIWKNNREWSLLNELDLKHKEVVFIWEKHDLFRGPASRLAKKLNVPFISYVHAPVVWEASKWGVRRYLWGRFLEKREAKNLKKADHIGVVSGEVKEKLLQMGVPDQKIFVSPMAVDPEMFKIKESKTKGLRKKLKLEGKFVIGWTGSFRSFHGLDSLVEAFSMVSEKFPDAVLMLVGDGNERRYTEKLIRDLKLSEKVIITGRKKFKEIPEYISLFDMAVVSARSSEGFHYSPLKLREYMAAGKPVLAPNAGEIPKLFQDEVHLKLFETGKLESLVEGMKYFISSSEVREKTGKTGEEYILQTNTWNVELEKILDRINR